MRMLDAAAKARHMRQNLSREIEYSYDTYHSPVLNKAVPKTKCLCDMTAQSMHKRDRMARQIENCIAIETACWEAVKTIPDREIRQKIISIYLLGTERPDRRVRAKIENYLLEREHNNVKDRI